MSMLNPNPNSKPKSFWKRPEGITGTVFIIAAAVLIIMFANPILVFIIGLLKNVITATIFFIVAAALLYVILDPKFRNLVWYLYRSVMRWLTGMFVQINPIAILETYIEYLYKNLRDMDTHISKLKGQIQKLQSTINANKEEMESNLKTAEAAKSKGNMELVAINTRQYGRLKEANQKYDELNKKMELLYRVLSKIHKNSGYLIKDLENEVRIKKQEAQAIRAGHSAMRSAMSIISGDPDKKMMFDLAMEALVDDVSNKIGEMQRFIEISGNVIDSIDLQNAVYEQEGLQLLEKMEKDGMSFLLGDTRIEDVDPKAKTGVQSVQANNEPNKFSDYSDLFK